MTANTTPRRSLRARLARAAARLFDPAFPAPDVPADRPHRVPLVPMGDLPRQADAAPAPLFIGGTMTGSCFVVDYTTTRTRK